LLQAMQLRSASWGRERQAQPRIHHQLMNNRVGNPG
jgi:hypothetical protein